MKYIISIIVLNQKQISDLSPNMNPSIQGSGNGGQQHSVKNIDIRTSIHLLKHKKKCNFRGIGKQVYCRIGEYSSTHGSAKGQNNYVKRDDKTTGMF